MSWPRRSSCFCRQPAVTWDIITSLWSGCPRWKKIFYASIYFTTMKSANAKKNRVFLGGEDDLPSLATGTESPKTICSHSLLLFESNRMWFVPRQSAFWRGCCMLSRWALHYLSILLGYTWTALPATGSRWCACSCVLRWLKVSCQIFKQRFFCFACQIFLKENIRYFLLSVIPLFCPAGMEMMF